MSQIAHFVDEVGVGFIRTCANFQEYSLREMISHSLKAKNKPVSEEQMEIIMSTLQIKGYLTDDAEIDIDALKRICAERNAAGMSIYSTKILEGDLAGHNFEVASVLDDLRNNYERAVHQSCSDFEYIKAQLASHGQKIIYAKVRNEIIAPMTNKAVVEASAQITDGIQSTLAKYSKGGLLTDALVGAAERAAVIARTASEARQDEATQKDLDPVIDELMNQALQDAAKEAGVSAGSEAATLEFIDKNACMEAIEQKLVDKFGKKVAQIIAVKIAARLPLMAAGSTNPIAAIVSSGFIAKDIYDIRQAIKEGYDSGEIDDVTKSDAFERSKDKQKEKEKSKVDSESKSTPSGGNLEPDDSDGDKDLFNPKHKDNHKRVLNHPKYKNFYESKTEKDVYYTKDIDQHGGSIWKKYKKGGGYMEWERDLDEFGKPIQNKHKSEASKNIDLKEFRGVK